MCNDNIWNWFECHFVERSHGVVMFEECFEYDLLNDGIAKAAFTHLRVLMSQSNDASTAWGIVMY